MHPSYARGELREPVPSSEWRGCCAGQRVSQSHDARMLQARLRSPLLWAEIGPFRRSSYASI